MKIDLYNHERRYKSWKEYVKKHGEDGLTKKNSDLLIQYIFDMEIGANVSIKSKRGGRSFHRLDALREKVSRVFRMMQERSMQDVTKLTDTEVQKFFDDMRRGVILNSKGEIFKCPSDYVKSFKAFWHWYQKVNAKKGKTIPDITEYVDSKADEKPLWVYLDEGQMSVVLKNISPRYLPLLQFLLDSGARVTETFSLRGRDIEEKNGIVYFNIPQDVAKSIGRKAKLMLCGKDILAYKKNNDIGEYDLLFPLSAPYVNRHLKEVAAKVLGTDISKGGEKYCNLTMYDFRHNSACYWLPRYKTNSNLMYRFGWKSEKYIHYYSEFLGMKDTISEDDMYVDITKTELEKKYLEVMRRLDQVEKRRQSDLLKYKKEVQSIRADLTQVGKVGPPLVRK